MRVIPTLILSCIARNRYITHVCPRVRLAGGEIIASERAGRGGIRETAQRKRRRNEIRYRSRSRCKKRKRNVDRRRKRMSETKTPRELEKEEHSRPARCKAVDRQQALSIHPHPVHPFCVRHHRFSRCAPHPLLRHRCYCYESLSPCWWCSRYWRCPNGSPRAALPHPHTIRASASARTTTRSTAAGFRGPCGCDFGWGDSDWRRRTKAAQGRARGQIADGLEPRAVRYVHHTCA
ncbi:hypothetical protein C8R44DRAFT_821738 [Mycena epipterygia]|nr:hypothetical protein C8R44DRAFT_821738 [Mycena epipterygia]